MSFRKLLIVLVSLALFVTPAFSVQAPKDPATTSTAAAASILKGDALTLPPLKKISREQQIELALSAAPREISSKAHVYVLEAGGYAKVQHGSNGFSCLVEQSLRDQTVEPMCYDREGSATTLLVHLSRENWRVLGLAETEIQERIAEGYKKGTFKAPSKPGLIYMLSPQSKTWSPFTKTVMATPPRLMFYAPYAKQQDFGEFAGVEYPFVAWEGTPEAQIVVIIGADARLPQKVTGAVAHHQGSSN